MSGFGGRGDPGEDRVTPRFLARPHPSPTVPGLSTEIFSLTPLTPWPRREAFALWVLNPGSYLA